MPKYDGPVRIADASCEEEAMRLCRELHEENGLFSLNEDKVRATLRKSFDRQGGILGIIGTPAKIEAMICMIISSFWYSDDPHLEELFIFVCQEHRKSKHAVELIRFAKWAADEGKIPLVIGVISDERTAGKVRLYQRELDRAIGNFFVYGLKKYGLERLQHRDDDNDGAKSGGDVGIL
jgi:hypothetical protein